MLCVRYTCIYSFLMIPFLCRGLTVVVAALNFLLGALCHVLGAFIPLLTILLHYVPVSSMFQKCQKKQSSFIWQVSSFTISLPMIASLLTWFP